MLPSEAIPVARHQAGQLLIYGATGYTGRLIAAQAARQGLRPILAGRTRERLEALASTLGGHEIRTFELDDPQAVRAALADVTAVLSVAGPFRRTARALVDACLHTGTHYLDIAGEVPEFEALLGRDAEARARGVMLLPGVGFGVVPTDCLALYLKNRLPDATGLTLAFETTGGASRGTALTVIEDLPRGGVLRRNGRLDRVGTGSSARNVDFGAGPKRALVNPWRGDLTTAFVSTGIPNIESFSVMPSPMRELVSLSPYLGWLFATPFVHNALRKQAAKQPEGPTASQRAAGSTRIWGQVENARGQKIGARLAGPDAYDFTALSAAAAAARVLGGRATPGFQTPATLFGPDFVLEIPGVTRTDV